MTPFEFDWSVQKAAFEPDGALRDLHVLDATLEDWQRFIAHIVQRYGARMHGTGAAPLVEDVIALLSTDPIRKGFLAFRVGGVWLHCHFFDVEEIELDFDPREIREPQLRALLDFMAEVGDLLAKPVRLTRESWPEFVFFEYAPGPRRMRWIPLRSEA